MIRDPEKETEKKTFKYFIHLCPNVFYRVVGGNARRAKNVEIIAHRSVKNLSTQYVFQLTAAPITNKPIDLYGLLRLFWQEA